MNAVALATLFASAGLLAVNFVFFRYASRRHNKTALALRDSAQNLREPALDIALLPIARAIKNVQFKSLVSGDDVAITHTLRVSKSGSPDLFIIIANARAEQLCIEAMA